MLVLADRGDEQKVIEEEKHDWLVEVLLALGISEQLFELDMEDMKEHLSSSNIEVWNNYDGALDVYKNDEIVAQWKVPRLILIKDKPNWYYEIHIDSWAKHLQKLEK